MSEQSKYREKIKESKGVLVHWACVSFEASIEMHKKNSEEILNYISNPIIEPFIMFPTMEHRKQKIESDKEVIRLLHNYVASAKTLVERSRIFKNKYLLGKKINEYDKKIENLLTKTPVILFVQNLRNYLLHKGNPSIVDTINAEENTNNIGLIPQKLLEWDKWDSNTKKHLKSFNEKEYLYLSFVVNEYNSETYNISEWLLKSIIISNELELSKLYELHKKYIETGKGLIFDPYLSNNYLLDL